MQPSASWLLPDVSATLVVAHPDDETLAFGGQLTLPLDVTFIFVTDGAPRNMRDASAHGFIRWQDYAEARRQETRNALELTSLREIRIKEIGVPDQEAVYQVTYITEWLTSRFREQPPALILTHPFEGGHPDHDATALAVQIAVRESRALAPILEFTGYHLSRGALVSGRFLAEQADEVLSIELTRNACDLKSRMIDCFTTQSDSIRQLMGCCERFRYAPTYNFRRRPHRGPLFYETWESGMRWEQWLQCVDRFVGYFHD